METWLPYNVKQKATTSGTATVGRVRALHHAAMRGLHAACTHDARANQGPGPPRSRLCLPRLVCKARIFPGKHPSLVPCLVVLELVAAVHAEHRFGRVLGLRRESLDALLLAAHEAHLPRHRDDRGPWPERGG